MKIKNLTIASVVGVLALATSAQAVVIAGWDFSQHMLPGASAGGGSPLPATNASLDPNGAGAEAGVIGRATYDDGVLLPTAGIGGNCERIGPDGTEGCATPNVDGPVAANRSEPFDLGIASFDAFSILKGEGQGFTNRYGMTATADTSVVFGTNAGYTGGASNWMVSFGGRMLTGAAGTVDVEFSSNGTSYTSFGTVNLTEDDQRFSVALAPGASAQGFVRLTLDTAGGQPVIDNVAIEATPIPEPGAIAMLVSGVGCLLGLARLRRR